MRVYREFPISFAPGARVNRAADIRDMVAEQRDVLADRHDRMMAITQWLCVVGFAACVIGAGVVAYML